MKKIMIVTHKFNDCRYCPSYYYDANDDIDFCLMMNPSRQVNKYGEGIPDWCELEADSE
jgi:hypothetical protein